MVAGSLFAAAPAQAGPLVCAGTASTAVICVDPTGGTLYEDCVYVASTTCTPVHVPGPVTYCGGFLYCDPR
jgi:hypothetical protein